MKYLVLILAVLFITSVKGQTFIEMMSPADASIILMEVDSAHKADICIYKTKKLKETNDLVWKFKKLGFSTYTIFIAKYESEFYVSSEDSFDNFPEEVQPQGNVYFVDNIEEVKNVTGKFVLKKNFGKLKVKRKIKK